MIGSQMAGGIPSVQLDQKKKFDINSLLESPLFMGGLALLGSDGQKPFQSALGGIGAASRFKDNRRYREDMAAERKHTEFKREIERGEIEQNQKYKTELQGWAADPNFNLDSWARFQARHGKSDGLNQLLASQMSFDNRLTLQNDAQAHQAKMAANAQSDGPQIGQYNPRDYTPQSFAQFQQSGDPSALERYEAFMPIDLGGGRKALVDRTTGQIVGEPISANDFNTNLTDTKRAGAQGSAQGNAMTLAQESLGALDNQSAQLERLMASPDFEASVGPIDAITGGIGEKFGSKEGVLGGEVDRTANALAREAAKSWKGAISEKELELFMASVPGRSSSPETWRTWYQNEFLPRKRHVEGLATGSAFGVNQPDPVSNDVSTEGLVNGIKWKVVQ